MGVCRLYEPCRALSYTFPQQKFTQTHIILYAHVFSQLYVMFFLKFFPCLKTFQRFLYLHFNFFYVYVDIR